MRIKQWTQKNPFNGRFKGAISLDTSSIINKNYAISCKTVLSIPDNSYKSLDAKVLHQM